MSIIAVLQINIKNVSLLLFTAIMTACSAGPQPAENGIG
jgi:hypothetical protein